MPSKQEIQAKIHEGIQKVEQTFSGLTDEQLATQVHEGDGGWTAHQVLAHLAGRGETYAMLSQMAQGSAPPGGLGDIHAWNQRIVDERANSSRDDLLSEFRTVHEQLAARVEGMPEQVLNQEIALPRGQSTVGDVLYGSGGQHSIDHSEEVERALGQ